MENDSWIQTANGRMAWPLNPEGWIPYIDDVAIALSHLCRFGGQTPHFYSVAQHCLQVSYAVSEEHALAGLLHDVAEAYLVDLPSPIKRTLPAYSEIEDKLIPHLLHYLAPDVAFPWTEEVLEADVRMLATERRDLLAPAPAPWGIEHVKPYRDRVAPMNPDRARVMFLRRYEELTR